MIVSASGTTITSHTLVALAVDWILHPVNCKACQPRAWPHCERSLWQKPHIPNNKSRSQSNSATKLHPKSLENAGQYVCSSQRMDEKPLYFRRFALCSHEMNRMEASEQSGGFTELCRVFCSRRGSFVLSSNVPAAAGI